MFIFEISTTVTTELTGNNLIYGDYLTDFSQPDCTGQITTDPIIHFVVKWPRNFTIAFIIEAFIVQPIARFVMANVHRFATNSVSNKVR